MVNAYKLYVGRPVSYLTTSAKWVAARVVSITDVNNAVLRYGNGATINGGAAVARRTAATQTNVWRPY